MRSLGPTQVRTLVQDTRGRGLDLRGCAVCFLRNTPARRASPEQPCRKRQGEPGQGRSPAAPQPRSPAARAARTSSLCVRSPERAVALSHCRGGDAAAAGGLPSRPGCPLLTHCVRDSCCSQTASAACFTAGRSFPPGAGLGCLCLVLRDSSRVLLLGGTVPASPQSS